MLSEIQSDLSSITNTADVLGEAVKTLVEEYEQLASETASHFAEIENLVNQSDTHLMEIEDLCEIHGFYTCGGTGGWRRVAYLNMTDSNTADCPSAWPMTNNDVRTCGRTGGYSSCDSVYFPVSGGEYSQVCGKIQGYQFGWATAFWGYHSSNYTIDQAYFSGVAVMHGSPRLHIWSFVSGAARNDESEKRLSLYCPCATQVSSDFNSPPFVGDDYFCESGLIWPGEFSVSIYSFHSDDPLWDGDGCQFNNTCCTFNNPPYFIKYLDNPTTDDIELRMCGFQPDNTENMAVQNVEIYVK